tara:strand:+ start:106 stop:288 length:183 start_codon:yes stop_codon:yes gene_type:complete
MDEMNITSAQYVKNYDDINTQVRATIDGEILHVPFDLNNRHYAEIMRQVDAGTLTIKDAD